MMTREDRQEALSLAYVHAVAAICGMTYSAPSKDYGIDLRLNEVNENRGRFAESGFSLDIQAKSTTSALETRTTIGFDLPVRTYDVLRTRTAIRRVLAVLILPADESAWLRQSRAKLELRKCVYWVSFQNRLPVANRSSLRVVIPKRQLFTCVALREIMDRIRRGEALT